MFQEYTRKYVVHLNDNLLSNRKWFSGKKCLLYTGNFSLISFNIPCRVSVSPTAHFQASSAHWLGVGVQNTIGALNHGALC